MVSKKETLDQSHVMVSLVSGDIAFRFLSHVKNRSPRGRQRMETADTHVTVCDINKAMLDVGQQRAARFNHSSGAHTGYLDVLVLNVLCVQKEYNYVFNASKITRIEGHLCEI